MNARKFSRIMGGTQAPPEGSHRQRLEDPLLAAYDARTWRSLSPRRAWLRHTPAIAFILVLLTASRVPARYQVELGKRITLQFPGGDPPETAPRALALAIEQHTAPTVSVSLQIRRVAGRPTVLIANAWGDHFPTDALLVERLRELPEFAQAQIAVAPLEGRIDDNLGGLARHFLFNPRSSPEARERARQALIEELRRQEGTDARIDVQVDERESGQEVRVKVLKTRPSP